MGYGSDNIRLALDTIGGIPAGGIPAATLNFMEHRVIERLAGAPPGAYARDPYGVYLRMQRRAGVAMIDQMLAENPLTMGDSGYEGVAGKTATTGGRAVLDGMTIDSPEAAAGHIERYACPRLERDIRDFDEAGCVRRIIAEESRAQRLLGPGILKAGFGAPFPSLEYGVYGYENYFAAYALYPEVIGRLFRLQGDWAERCNAAMAKAFVLAGRPLYCRLDHDMADGSGLLVSMKSLERLWLPHFARSIGPLVRAGFALPWHSDGNLNALYPALVECGVNGFQGFQYECGMDYRRICATKTRDRREPLIIAGVSVTRTLPFGTPSDVRDEMRFLVENGPKAGLFLSLSSSCTPGTPWENIRTFVEGLAYYRKRAAR